MEKGSPQEQDGKASKNETLTFRIDHDNVKKLRTEAESQGISLNSLINQILKGFLEWHIFEPKIGMVPLSKPVIEEIFTKMSKEQIVDIATRVGRNEMQNAAMFMKGGKMDLGSFLSWFENRMKNSSIQVSHTFDNSGRTHMYIIKHDICENWSLYIKEILLYIFHEIYKKRVDINTSYKMLMFRYKQED